MNDIELEERAQLGLKQIEDAVVGLLSRHDDGLTADTIAARLGLADGLAPEKHAALVGAILDLLSATDRITRDPTRNVYLDNPDKI